MSSQRTRPSSTNGTTPSTSRCSQRCRACYARAASARRAPTAAMSRSITWSRPRCKPRRHGKALPTRNGRASCGPISATICASSASATPAPADTSSLSRSAQAIVVLGAAVHFGNGASAPDTLGPLSLERVVYAAEAYRRLHLPVAVSGGRVYPAQTAEAVLIRAALDRDFGVPVAWSDDQSRTTYENAFYTARLVNPERIATVVVVTHAWHLPRALWAFERAGLHALPWPVPRDFVRLRRIDDVLPSIV